MKGKKKEEVEYAFIEPFAVVSAYGTSKDMLKKKINKIIDRIELGKNAKGFLLKGNIVVRLES